MMTMRGRLRLWLAITSSEMMAKIVRAYPVGRVGKGSDIAHAVAFLCSDQAEFITGQTLAVNGGFLTV